MSQFPLGWERWSGRGGIEGKIKLYLLRYNGCQGMDSKRR